MRSSPVRSRDFVNGTILFNCETLDRETRSSKGFRLVFQDGKIVEAEAGGGTEKLNEILDLDQGARYIGRMVVGVHWITPPMPDMLFDEKIAGFHFTPGQAYGRRTTATFGVRSTGTWCCLQTPELGGGGEIDSDYVLIRKDGRCTAGVARSTRTGCGSADSNVHGRSMLNAGLTLPATT